jgi:hypothetical protein
LDGGFGGQTYSDTSDSDFDNCLKVESKIIFSNGKPAMNGDVEDM